MHVLSHRHCQICILRFPFYETPDTKTMLESYLVSYVSQEVYVSQNSIHGKYTLHSTVTETIARIVLRIVCEPGNECEPKFHPHKIRTVEWRCKKRDVELLIETGRRRATKWINEAYGAIGCDPSLSLENNELGVHFTGGVFIQCCKLRRLIQSIRYFELNFKFLIPPIRFDNGFRSTRKMVKRVCMSMD